VLATLPAGVNQPHLALRGVLVEPGFQGGSLAFLIAVLVLQALQFLSDRTLPGRTPFGRGLGLRSLLF